MTLTVLNNYRNKSSQYKAIYVLRMDGSNFSTVNYQIASTTSLKVSK